MRLASFLPLLAARGANLGAPAALGAAEALVDAFFAAAGGEPQRAAPADGTDAAPGAAHAAGSAGAVAAAGSAFSLVYQVCTLTRRVVFLPRA